MKNLKLNKETEITKQEAITSIGEYFDNLAPIPLTEEWMFRFGFEKINHVNGYSFYSLSGSKKNRLHIDVYENTTKYYGHSVKHCDYVHQLQNLYFALTGKELEFESTRRG